MRRSNHWEAQFAGKRVLITGGAGFIGATLGIRLTDLGAHVVAVDSLISEYGGNLHNLAGYEDRITLNIADVRDQFGLNILVRDQDYLFNLAGQTSHLDSMIDPFTDLEINCRSQLKILEACRQNNPGVRIVFASTRQIYGRPRYLPVDEQHPLNPADVNGINKLAGEMYHLLYAQVYHMATCVLRLTNTYGPRMRVKDARQTFLGIWMRKLIEQQPLQIYGEGQQLRDFNYVDDVVEALLLAAVHPNLSGQAYNLGGGEVLTLEALARLAVEVNGGGAVEKIPFPPERKVIDIGDYYANYTAFSQLTGWQPRVKLAAGLRATLDYYREHGQHYWNDDAPAVS